MRKGDVSVADWFCGKCGARNDDDDGFCISCGAERKRRRDGAPAKASSDEVAIVPAPPSGIVEPDEPERPSKRRAREAKASKHEAQADLLRVATLQAAHQLVRPRQSLNALLALICAVGGMLSAFVIEWGAIVPVLIGLVLGRIAVKEIDASDGHLVGRAGATFAVWIGWGLVGLLALGAALLAASSLK